MSSLNGLDAVQIPLQCEAHRHDACALFECMVDLCWCSEGYPGPVLHEGNEFVLSESEARYAVEDYLKATNSSRSIESIAQMNSAFYNVFVSDGAGNEETLTVAADGSIIKTICGV